MKDYKIKLANDYGRAVLQWLLGVHGHEGLPRNAYRALALITTAKTVERFHGKLLTTANIEMKLPYREAFALQILLCTSPWPDGYEQAALYTLQSQLPTLPDLEVKSLTANPVKQINQ